MKSSSYQPINLERVKKVFKSEVGAALVQYPVHSHLQATLIFVLSHLPPMSPMMSSIPGCESPGFSTPEDLVIVGGGACGIAVILHVIEKVKQGKQINTITLIEKDKAAGPGLAYSEACKGTILNMHADTMGLYINDPLHFSKWREGKYSGSEELHFPLRSQYGHYLCSQLNFALEESCRLGIRLRVMCGEVIDFHRERETFQLELSNHLNIRTQTLVLALGNFMKASHSELHGTPGYLPSPWPNSLLREIPPDSSISVLGSGLTAIDVAVCLAENGHQGPITLISRSGRLPKVQGNCEPYCRKYKLHCLAKEVEQHPERSLVRIVENISQEIQRRDGRDFPLTQAGVDYLTEFQADIRASEECQTQWQEVLRATAPVIERYWNTFSDSTKDFFLREFSSTWMTYRHAIPLHNARKILALLDRGQLKVCRGEKAIWTGAEFVVSVTGEEIRSQWLIEAVGQEHNPYKTGSKLLNRLLDAGELTAHPAGGVAVDFGTLAASKNLYVVGSMTRGTHFYTSAIDRNVAHAARIADSITNVSPSRPSHVGLFVGTDIISHLMTSKIVSQLIALGHTPFVFLPNHKRSKKPNHFDLEELAFFERYLHQDIVIPFLGSSNPRGSKCMTVEQMRIHHGILVQHVPSVNDPAFLEVLRDNHIDIGVSIRCYQKFGTGIINYFNSPKKLLNLHPGILPKYRGVMTTVRAMKNGEENFGYSLHEIDENWDAGHVLDIKTHPLDNKRPMLLYMNDVYDIGVQMVVNAIDKYSRGQVLPAVKQIEAESQYYTFPTADDLADYRRSNISLVNSKEMVDLILDSYSTPDNKDHLKEVLDIAVHKWYLTKKEEWQKSRISIMGGLKSVN